MTATRHTLTNINREAMTADCAVCGTGARLLLHRTRDSVYCARGRTPGRTKEEWHRLSDINEEQGTALCSKCGRVAFVNQGRSGIQCAVQAGRRARSNYVKRKYGEAGEALDVLRGGELCECCEKRLAFDIDHDHETGVVRGLLCRQCNMALGLLGEDTKTMRAMIRYVKKHKEK